MSKPSTKKQTTTLADELADDVIDAPEITVSRYYSINKLMAALKDELSADTKFVQVYFDNMYDNTKFDPKSKSKNVRVLACGLLSSTAFNLIPWEDLETLAPNLKYLTIKNPATAKHGSLNKVIIDVKQMKTSQGFSYHKSYINPKPVNQGLYDKILTAYNEHFEITEIPDID